MIHFKTETGINMKTYTMKTISTRKLCYITCYCHDYINIKKIDFEEIKGTRDKGNMSW